MLAKNQLKYIDLCALLISGFLIGYYGQISADSGERYTEKILISMLISGSSFFLSYILLSRTSDYYKKIPKWIQMCFLGSILCYLSLHVIKYSIDNWKYRNSDSIFEYIEKIAPHMILGFFVIGFIYFILSVSIVGLIHLIIYVVNRRKII